MSKTYTPEEERRILEIHAEVEGILLNLTVPLRELFETIYKGKYADEYKQIQQYILFIDHELNFAEMLRSHDRNVIPLPWEGRKGGDGDESERPSDDIR